MVYRKGTVSDPFTPSRVPDGDRKISAIVRICPRRESANSREEFALSPVLSMVPRDGIEPPTRGFSVLCSSVLSARVSITTCVTSRNFRFCMRVDGYIMGTVWIYCTDGALLDRFASKVDMSGSCWTWTAWIDHHGYGRLYFGRRNTEMAHRLSYQWAKGPIPEGLTIDHICRNRSCVRPDHLRAITRVENVMCGVGAAANNKRKTTCKRGHPFNAFKGSGKRIQRYCTICKGITERARYARR